MKWKILGIAALCLPMMAMAAESEVPLTKAPIDITDSVSLQRGAKLYMGYCSGCHSLQYVRYSDLAKGIEIVDESGEVLADVVKSNLMFAGNKLTDQITVNMPPQDSSNWFGKAPPDLTLVARLRGIDWLYSYLRSFYRDDSKPWGVNNTVYPDVGMPHVMAELQGLQIPVYKTTRYQLDGKDVERKEVMGFKIETPGQLKPAEFDQAITDLVNFLSYVAEPVQVERKKLGVWVMAFLGIFFVFSYLLKREYWKDVH